MKKSIVKIARLTKCVAFMVVASMAVTPANAEVLYVIGGPATLDAEDLPGFTKSVIRVVLNADAGDRVRVIDALNQRSIADIEVPRSRTDRARLRFVAPKIASIQSHYRRAEAVSNSQSHLLHLPNLLDTIASVTAPEFEQIRILMIGSMFFGDGKDTRFDFSAGTYPSDGHILATREKSTYGTLGGQELKNARIDVLNLDPIVDDRDRYYIQRFWTLYASERGVTISSWQTDAKLAVEMALKDIHEPFMNVELDRQDLRREIRRVSGPSIRPNTWTLVICIDASASMDQVFDAVRREIPRLAERVYDAGAEIRLCVIPYRQDALGIFPLTQIRSSGSDGGRSVSNILQYLAQVSLVTSPVDPGTAVRAAIMLLAADPSPTTNTCLLLIGDTGPENEDPVGTASQILADAGAWQNADDGRTLHGVFLGDHDDTRIQLFQELSALSDNPVGMSFEDVADRIVLQAANMTRGIPND